MIGYQVRFKNRDFSDRPIQDGLTYVVNRYSFQAIGGPERLAIGAKGSDLALWEMAEMLRCPVEVYDESGRCVWWGMVYRVTVRTAAVAMDLSLSMDSMANKVRCRYSYIAPGSNVVGQVMTTAWVTNLDSIAEYGTREYTKNLGGSTAAAAEALRDALLGRVGLPALDPPASSGAQNSASSLIECVGWWKTLNWMYADVGLTVGPSLSSGTAADQDLGKAAGNTMLFQQVLVGAQAINVKAVAINIKKTGSPTDDVAAKIYTLNGSGVPTGSPLATGTIAGSGLSTSTAWTTITFGAEANLAAATLYGLEIYRSGAVDASNYYTVQVDTGLGYAGGFFKLWNGSSWGNRSPNADLMFRILQNNNVDVATQIVDLISHFGQFLSGSYLEKASGLVESSYRDGSTLAQSEIEQLIEKGVSGGRRYVASVDVNRLAILTEEPAPDQVTYLLKKDRTLETVAGGEVLMHTCPVGAWCGLKDILPPSVDFSLMTAPTPFWIEWSEYDPQTGEWTYKTREEMTL